MRNRKIVQLSVKSFRKEGGTFSRLYDEERTVYRRCKQFLIQIVGPEPVGETVNNVTTDMHAGW